MSKRSMKGLTMTMTRMTSLVSLVALTSFGCAATPGAKPHDMSAARHEREANAHARVGDAHAAQYDPEAVVARERCSAAGVRGGGDVCWTSSRNPTAEHLRRAEEHRRHAADHRAASVALRDAETRVCAGIAPDARDISPFEHTEDIAAVEPLRERVRMGARATYGRTAGAIITFRAVPGMTAEWLQRVVDCHLARNAALGHEAPNMPSCPLVPQGVEASVQSTGDGFAVKIRAESAESAREVLERAQRLMPRK